MLQSERTATQYYQTSNCVVCNKPIGKLYMSQCDTCRAPIHVTHRGLRMFPYECPTCKQRKASFQQQINISNTPPSPTTALNNNVKIAEKITEIENLFDNNIEKAIEETNKLYKEIRNY